jgi:hypothetical protein
MWGRPTFVPQKYYNDMSIFTQKHRLGFMVMLAVFFAACTKEKNNEPDGLPKTLDCFIENNLTLTDHNKNGTDYVADCIVKVSNGTLTIEPGVSIEFKNNAALHIKGNGALLSVGNATSPIVMKGTLGQPSWGGIYISSNNPLNELSHTRLEQAAQSNNYYLIAGLNSRDYAAAIAVNGRVKINNLTIDGSAGAGLVAGGDADITNFANVTIRNCGESPLVLYPPQVNKMALNTCTFNSNTDNFVDLYGVTSNESVDLPTVLKTSITPYRAITPLNFASASLTLDAGVTIVFGAGNFIAMGGNSAAFITANGTADKPVLLKGALPLKGFWGGLYVASNNVQNVLTHTYITDGGQFDYDFNPNFKGNFLLAFEARLTLNNCRSGNFEGCAVYNNGGTLVNNSPEITAADVCQ